MVKVPVRRARLAELIFAAETEQNCEHAVDGDAVLEDGRRSTGLNRPGVNSSRYKGNRFADHDDSRHYGNGSEKRPLPSTPSPKRPSIPLDTPASGTIRPTSASPATLAPTTATVLLPPPPPPAFRAPRRLVTAEPRAQLPEADVAWLVDGLGGVCDLLGRVLAPEDDAGGGLAVLGARELRACQGFVGAALRELRGYLVQFPGGGVRLRRGWQRERADQVTARAGLAAQGQGVEGRGEKRKRRRGERVEMEGQGGGGEQRAARRVDEGTHEPGKRDAEDGAGKGAEEREAEQSDERVQGKTDKTGGGEAKEGGEQEEEGGGETMKQKKLDQGEGEDGQELEHAGPTEKTSVEDEATLESGRDGHGAVRTTKRGARLSPY